jgi:plastocyanin
MFLNSKIQTKRMARRLAFGILTLMILAVLLSSCQQSAQQTTAPAETSKITIKDFAFNPQSVTINAGTKVIWTNFDTEAHELKSSLFDQTIYPGNSYSYTFNHTGNYSYYCLRHSLENGTIIVK